MRLATTTLSSVVFACAIAIATPARAAGVTPAAATAVQREQAQGRFLKGKDLYNRGKYDAALIEFTASLDVVASPNTRLYVGRCLRETGHLVEAYVDLGRTAVEAKELARDDPRYQKAAEAADDERKQLEPKIGFVMITIAHPGPSTTLRVAGDEVRRGGWSEPVPVKPGTVEVIVDSSGHAPIRRDVQLAAGEKKTLAVDAGAEVPEPAPTDPNASPVVVSTPSSNAKLRPWAYVAGGVGIAGLATFAIFGLKANGTYSDLQHSCPNGPCPPGHEDDISSGRTSQTVANVGLVVGLVGAAAGVTLYVMSMPKKAAPPSAATALVVGPGSLGVKGAF